MKSYFLIAFFIVALLGIMSSPACKHDSALIGGGGPLDTIPNPGDTTTIPGGNMSGVPCSPDSVYFQNQVLPLLISNCTQSTCHNTTDRRKGVVLSSYNDLLNTVGHVTHPNWDENKLMRVLTETDPDKRMPYGKPPLTQEQINLIGAWIAQGARNNGCNENSGTCETAGTKYSTFVKTLIQARCQGCHSGTSPQGNVNLSTHAGVQTVALNGKLYSAVTRTANWMPRGGAKLDACSLAKLKVWIDAGALNN